jgi:hypothetical protein
MCQMGSAVAGFGERSTLDLREESLGVRGGDKSQDFSVPSSVHV